jgi:hypothetical protein
MWEMTGSYSCLSRAHFGLMYFLNLALNVSTLFIPYCLKGTTRLLYIMFFCESIILT